MVGGGEGALSPLQPAPDLHHAPLLLAPEVRPAPRHTTAHHDTPHHRTIDNEIMLLLGLTYWQQLYYSRIFFYRPKLPFARARKIAKMSRFRRFRRILSHSWLLLSFLLERRRCPTAKCRSTPSLTRSGRLAFDCIQTGANSRGNMIVRNKENDITH